jgi:hypothetical protein
MVIALIGLSLIGSFTVGLFVGMDKGGHLD